MSIKKKLFITACAVFLSTTALASADNAIIAAKAAQKAAAQVGYEWRDTAKIIKQARKLAKEGKTEQAITLANKAEQQGHSAVAQYHAEQKRYQLSH